MNWTSIGVIELRRQAVICGVARTRGDAPYTDGDKMSLCRTAGAAPPVRGTAKKVAVRRAANSYRCHMRPDGQFFFLDVPPGAYELRRVDSQGQVAQVDKVVLPPFDSKTKVPIVRIAYQVRDAKPARGASSDPVRPSTTTGPRPDSTERN